MTPASRVLAVIVLLAATCAPATLYGQDEGGSGEITLDDFRLAAPPALALLGISAASVSRPNTPRALIASLVSGAGSSGLVPNGYALETSPYWLVRHPALTLRDYYAASTAARLVYFTAFSAATSRPSQGPDSLRDARVAIAARTLLFNGRPSRALMATSDSMRALQITYISRYRRLETAKAATGGFAARQRQLERNEELLSTLVTKAIVGATPALRDSTLRTLARRDSARAAVAAGEAALEEVTRLEKEIESLDAKLARLAEHFGDRDAEPDGFVLEIAAGTRASFAGAEWDRAKSDGLGVWVTPMYRPPGSHFEIIAVVRYLTRVADYDQGDLLDTGARAGWAVGRSAFSAEWTRRDVLDEAAGSSNRWVAIFDYKLPSRLSLVASFGSDFMGGDGERPVIATLGLNLGIGAVMLVPSGK